MKVLTSGVDNIKNLKINVIKASVFILGLFLLNPVYSAPLQQSRVLRIGILDTPFCPHLIKNENKNVTILQAYSKDKSLEKTCSTDLNGRHGFHVLNHFLKVIPKLNYPIEIHPIIIFSKDALQSPMTWKNALDHAKEKKIDVLLLAVGLPTQTIPTNLKIKSFMASGQSSGRIRKKTTVWPQSEKDPHLSIMIGSYIPPTRDLPLDYLQDKTLLHLSKIDYYFSGGGYNARLTGSSRAVTTALGKALSLCPRINFIDHNIKGLRACLKTKQKILKDPLSKFEFATY